MEDLHPMKCLNGKSHDITFINPSESDGIVPLKLQKCNRGIAISHYLTVKITNQNSLGSIKTNRSEFSFHLKGDELTNDN